MKAFASIVLLLLVGTMTTSLFLMSADMSMSHGMGDCPFMAYEEVLCPMNLMDHIAAWKSAFLATVPATFLLLSLVSVVTFTSNFLSFLLRTQRRSVSQSAWQIRERTYRFCRRFLQDMFARGILHPKRFRRSF